MADSPATKSDIRDLILEVRNMPGVRTSTSGNDTLLNTSGAITGVTNSVIDGFGKLAGGTATTSDAFGVATNIVSKFGAVGEVAAKALNQLGDGAFGTIAAMRETSKVGVTMAGDLFKFNEEIKGAHLTIPEFTDMLSRSSRSIAGVGGTMDKSASAFLKVAAEVQASPIAVDLKAYGVTARELAEITELSMIGQRGLNSETAKGRLAMRDAAAAAVELSLEMATTAALTGKSRKQQQEELRAQQEKAEVQATMLLMGPEFTKNFTAAQEGMSKFGKSYQDLLTEMATPGGIRTKEGMQLAASLPPGQLEAMQAYADAIKTGDKERIAAQKQSTEGVLANTGSNKEFQNTVAVLGDRFLKSGQVLKDSFPIQQAIASKIEEVKEKEGKIIDGAEALKRMSDQEIKDAIKGGKTDPKTGVFTPDDRAVVSRTVNQLDNLGKVAAAGLAKEFTGLSKNVSIFSTDGIVALNRKFKEMASPEGLKSTVTGGVDTVIKKGAEKLGVKAPEVKPKAGFDVSAPLPPRQFGSLGAVGKLIEDFGKGTPAMLHGREGVITERQLSSIIDQAQTMGATEFSDKISKKTIANPMAEFAEVFEKLTTTAINPKSNPEISALTGLFNDFKTSMASVPKTSAPTIQTAFTPAPESRTVPTPAEQAVLKEVKEELVQLNISVKQLVAHSAETVDLSSKQVRATKGLSGNRFA